MTIKLIKWPNYLLLFTLLAAILAGCTRRDPPVPPPGRPVPRPEISDGGFRVTLPPGSPGLEQIHAEPVKRGTTLVSVIAPARVVASIAPMASRSGERVILFESPDIASLYSQFRQGKTNAERSTRNVERVKDMFDNHSATEKDVADAETELENSRAALAEYEAKLRAAGFNPVELGNTKPGTIWLISDVTETQLPDVDKNEDVDIYFASMPGKKFVGKADAIGEVVDPATRTVKVRISASNPGGKFLPGMFASVDFGDPVSGVYALPPSAVVTVEGNDYLFIEKSPGVYLRREVLIRYSGSKQLVIKDGLEDGDRVVTKGAMLLKGLSFGY